MLMCAICAAGATTSRQALVSPSAMTPQRVNVGEKDIWSTDAVRRWVATTMAHSSLSDGDQRCHHISPAPNSGIPWTNSREACEHLMSRPCSRPNTTGKKDVVVQQFARQRARYARQRRRTAKIARQSFRRQRHLCRARREYCTPKALPCVDLFAVR
jgi:hypothetical protein